MLKHYRLYVVLLFSVVMMTGCLNSGSPEGHIDKILDKTSEKERDFAENQEPLNKLEVEEKEIYEKTIKLGMKEYDKIVELSDEALKNIDKREALIEKEQESMEASEKQFNKMEGETEKIENQKVQKEAVKMEKTMSDRYRSYEELYEAYQQSLANDRELYELFKKKDLKMDELQIQVDKINKSYAKVVKANEKFNEITKKYNQEKESFYETAGIKETETDKK
ncbi:YkyA family protein [Peribacillus sp. NPDC097675]|uniref:YkyA family protein n=1 Tax=Peribacillus sp. NPDC097675 TaxID=3390618 RepID=UPI003D07B335